MSLMPKLSATLLLSASLFGATDAEVVAFLKKGIGNNPNITNLEIQINSKQAVPAMKGWQAYFVNIEGDVKQGNDKRHISQNSTYFVSGDVLAPELINLKTGERYNETVAPDFDDSFYTKANLISGDPSAPNKVAIFSDPLCPFCRKYVPDAVVYMAKYPKTFAVYYYHMPLASLHPAAVALTKAAIAAEQSGTKNAEMKMYATDINANETDEQKIVDQQSGGNETECRRSAPSVGPQTVRCRSENGPCDDGQRDTDGVLQRSERFEQDEIQRSKG